MTLNNEEPTPMQYARALGALDEARQKVEHLRRLVGAREAGAASLGVAEWEMHQALRDVERLKQATDYGAPLDAA